MNKKLAILALAGVTLIGAGVSAAKRVIGYVHGRKIDLDVAPLEGQIDQWLRRDAAAAFNAMFRAAKAAGVVLFVESSFRTMTSQEDLYAKYLDGTGNLAAEPGWSTHQAGLSADISTFNRGRASPSYQWLAANAARFGFVNDVPSEPWHWTFFG